MKSGRVVAIVSTRGGSKGITHKNIMIEYRVSVMFLVADATLIIDGGRTCW